MKPTTKKSTAKLNAAIAPAIRNFKPPEDLTVAEWADRHRRLSPENSAESGPWRTSRTPYLREPMEAFTDPKIRKIVMVAASQVGKSELELNIIGYIIDQDPGSILFVQPSLDDARKFSRLRIAPMIRDSKVLNVIVEGIAASAASVIMCAGDTVTVYPGSLIMIHGVSVMLWDYMNMQDMKQLMKGMDASERAVAEIYNSKTGIEVDTLRSMMTKETWFTGREALEKGFADAIKEDEDDPEMSMSADRKVLFVNGVRHNVDGLQHVPGTIPVKAIATPPAAKPGANKKKPTTKAAKKEGGNKPMDEKELRATYPEIVAQIEASARTEAQNASGEAVAAERQRIEQIDSIAASIPDQQLVHDAKYGDNPCTAQELCFRVMQASAASGQNFLAAYQAEGAKSGAADVGAAPNGGTPASAQEQDAADIQAVVSAYNQTKGGTK